VFGVDGVAMDVIQFLKLALRIVPIPRAHLGGNLRLVKCVSNIKNQDVELAEPIAI
jgi:hypothetical protein